MSTQKKPILTLTISATAAISKYLAVTAAGAVAAAGTEAFGFSVQDAKVGEDFAADVIGTTTAIAGAAIAAGARVQVGTGGKLITATTGISVGVARFAGATDQPFELLIDKWPAP